MQRKSRRVFLRVTLAATLFPAMSLPAQAGAFTGTVYRDSTDHPLANTEVVIVGTPLRTMSDSQGNFTLGAVPGGRHVVVLRHVGFSAITDTIAVPVGGRVDRAYELAPSIVSLSPVAVRDSASPYATPRLTEFLERKRTSIGGHFIDEAELRRDNGRKLQDIIVSKIPSLRVYQPDPKHRPTVEYLTSTRTSCTGRAFACSGQKCPVTLYIDGLIFYNPGINPAASSTDDLNASDIPNFSMIETSTLAGVEFYPGGASIPPQFNATTGGCGVLLLWTREK